MSLDSSTIREEYLSVFTSSNIWSRSISAKVTKLSFCIFSLVYRVKILSFKKRENKVLSWRIAKWRIFRKLEFSACCIYIGVMNFIWGRREPDVWMGEGVRGPQHPLEPPLDGWRQTIPSVHGVRVWHHVLKRPVNISNVNGNTINELRAYRKVLSSSTKLLLKITWKHTMFCHNFDSHNFTM